MVAAMEGAAATERSDASFLSTASAIEPLGGAAAGSGAATFSLAAGAASSPWGGLKARLYTPAQAAQSSSAQPSPGPYLPPSAPSTPSWPLAFQRAQPDAQGIKTYGM